MTIDEQIRDEKIQYDINREPTKISALSSSKIDKYEYLTGEESNQKQIIEPAQSTLLGKAFEKQTKTIKNQGEKHVNAIKNNKKQLANTNSNYYRNELLLSKEREMFKDIYNERLDKIEELTKKINHDDLSLFVQSSGDKTDLTEAEDPIVFLSNIRTDKINLEEAENLQEDFNEYLKRIQKGNKSVEQKERCQMLTCFLMKKNDAIKFVEDYGSMILEAKTKAIKR